MMTNDTIIWQYMTRGVILCAVYIANSVCFTEQKQHYVAAVDNFDHIKKILMISF